MQLGVLAHLGPRGHGWWRSRYRSPWKADLGERWRWPIGSLRLGDRLGIRIDLLGLELSVGPLGDHVQCVSALLRVLAYFDFEGSGFPHSVTGAWRIG